MKARRAGGRVLAAGFVVAAAAALSGCGGGSTLTNPGEWFSGFGKSGASSSSGFSGDTGFTVSRGEGHSLRPGPVAASELVGPDGSCAGAPAATVVGTSGAAPATPTVTAGITLAMTECQVVAAAGRPDHVDIGQAAGQRQVVMTYNQGSHAGTYTFRDGRLRIINAAPVPEKPAPKKRAPRKRKPKATQ